MENNNWNTNPLGENPLGEGFVADNSFGNRGPYGNDDSKDNGVEIKVCPHCGQTLAEEETYCMTCGMTVIPVLKKDYDRAVSDGQDPVAYSNAFNAGPSSGSSTGGSGYGGNSYGSGSGGSGYGGGSYGGQSRTSYSGRQTQSSSLPALIVGIIGVAAAIMVIFFIYKGMSARSVENTVVMYKQQKIDQMLDELTVTMIARGDKIVKYVEEEVVDVSGVDSRVIDIAWNKVDQKYAKYELCDYMKYSSKREGDKLIFRMEYSYLNIPENVQKLVDEGVLEYGDENSQYISLKLQKSFLKNQGYTEK